MQMLVCTTTTLSIATWYAGLKIPARMAGCGPKDPFRVGREGWRMSTGGCDEPARWATSRLQLYPIGSHPPRLNCSPVLVHTVNFACPTSTVQLCCGLHETGFAYCMQLEFSSFTS